MAPKFKARKKKKREKTRCDRAKNVTRRQGRMNKGGSIGAKKSHSEPKVSCARSPDEWFLPMENRA